MLIFTFLRFWACYFLQHLRPSLKLAVQDHNCTDFMMVKKPSIDFDRHLDTDLCTISAKTQLKSIPVIKQRKES